MYERIAATTVTVIFFIFLVTVCDCADCQNGYLNNSFDCIQCPVHCAFCNSSEFCFSCKEGFSGTKCQFSCSNCKPDTECDQDSGVCKEGCRDGFSGIRCEDVCDSKCQSCRRNNPTKCVTCKTNQTCKEVCSASCLSKNCTENKWGDSCDKECPLTCSKDVCNRGNGKCSEGNCTLGECDKRNGNRTEDNCTLGECNKRNGNRTEDADKSLPLNTLQLILAITSVLLVMMTGVVIYLICRQRNRRPSTGNGSEEMTVGMIDLQTLPEDFDVYHLPS